MDLGSAVLSAELALDLLDHEVARAGACCARRRWSRAWSSPRSRRPAAPDRDEVAAEAVGALAAKQAHLGAASAPRRRPPDAGGPPSVRRARRRRRSTVTNPHGLHARPPRAWCRQVARPRRRGASCATSRTRAGTGARGEPVAGRDPRRAARPPGRGPGDRAARRAEALDARARRWPRARFDEAGPPAGHGRPPTAAAGRDGAGPIPASPGIGDRPGVAGSRTGRRRRPRRAARRRRRPSGAGRRGDGRGPRATIERRPRHRPPARSARPRPRSSTPTCCCSTTPTCSPTSAPGSTAAPAPRGPGSDAARRGRRASSRPLADPYLRARAADVRAVARPGAARLSAAPSEQRRRRTGVLVADDLTPAAGRRARPGARSAASCSPAAARPRTARSCCGPAAIPAVVGAGAGVLDVADGTRRSPSTGPPARSSSTPTEPTLAALPRPGRGLRRRRATRWRRRARPGRHPRRDDGAGRRERRRRPRTPRAAAAGADLAGLVRTEFLLPRPASAARPSTSRRRPTARSPRRWAAGGSRCARSTSAATSRWTTCRMPPEANPFLGVRGIRLALARPRAARRPAARDRAGRARDPGRA